MSTTVQTVKNRGGSPFMKDNEIPFKSGEKAYLVSIVAALVAAVIVMWSLFVL